MWATAFFIVQGAADLVAAASRIVVANGRYATGRRALGTSVVVNRMAGVNDFLERSTDLPGQPGTTSFTDATRAGLSPLFYRVGVGY